MKKRQSKSKNIEIVCIDSEDDQTILSPTSPKTPKSLISQLSRDLSPPGKNGRRKSLMSFDNEDDKELSEADAQKSEIGGKREVICNRSLLSIDVCSYLGDRVKKFMQHQAVQTMSTLQSETEDGYEKFCHTPKKNEALARLRNRASDYVIAFKRTRKTCPKYAHQYKFKSSQRREWYLTSLFGLNARSRALKKLVKKCYVKLQKLSRKELDIWRSKRTYFSAKNNHSVTQKEFSSSKFNQKCLQDLLSGKIISSPDGQQFLLPNASDNSGHKILLPNTFTQQRIFLPKLDMTTLNSSGESTFNLIPSSSEQARPVHLVRHANGMKKFSQSASKSASKRKMLTPSKAPYTADSSKDVICLSSDEESNSSSCKPPPSKRQKVESKQKIEPTLLFKCHLCHNELTCQGNFAGYIENHFRQSHKVYNIQLIEHTDNKGQKIVSIVEKTEKRKTKNSSVRKTTSPGNNNVTQRSKVNLRDSVSQKKPNKTRSGSLSMAQKKNNVPEIICID